LENVKREMEYLEVWCGWVELTEVDHRRFR